MKVSSDLHRLLPYVTGVNVKIEKAGGIRSAIEALVIAESLGLEVIRSNNHLLEMGWNYDWISFKFIIGGSFVWNG